MQIDLSSFATNSDLESMKEEFEKKLIDIRINYVKILIEMHTRLDQVPLSNDSLMEEIADIRLNSIMSFVCKDTEYYTYFKAKYGKEWFDNKQRDMHDFTSNREELIKKLNCLIESEKDKSSYYFYKEWVNLITEYRFVFGKNEITEEHIKNNMFIDFFDATSDRL
jgi:hypothetical protein